MHLHFGDRNNSLTCINQILEWTKILPAISTPTTRFHESIAWTCEVSVGLVRWREMREGRKKRKSWQADGVSVQEWTNFAAVSHFHTLFRLLLPLWGSSRPYWRRLITIPTQCWYKITVAGAPKSRLPAKPSVCQKDPLNHGLIGGFEIPRPQTVWSETLLVII